jgi:AcrR family transcriptional regulator
LPRPNQSEARRRRLISEIARAFAELGYRRTTTAELAKRCGVQENILYRLWPDKKAMFIAAIEYVFELSSAIWEDIVGGQGATATSAERLLDYESRHHGEFGLYRIIFAGLSETDDREISDALRRLYRRFLAFIARQVTAHAKAGSRGGRLDPDFAAWAFIGLGTVANIGRELNLLNGDAQVNLFREVGMRLLTAAR